MQEMTFMGVTIRVGDVYKCDTNTEELEVIEITNFFINLKVIKADSRLPFAEDYVYCAKPLRIFSYIDAGQLILVDKGVDKEEIVKDGMIYNPYNDKWSFGLL